MPSTSIVKLSVPAEARFARAVRMTASNLAVCCDMSVDDVEDVRMAAEEGFVYACATRPTTCDIVFGLAPDGMTADFSLGDEDPDEAADPSGEPQPIDLVEVLLGAVNAQETTSTQETEEERAAREASEARAERARHRSLHRTPKGKAAWDKDRTRELFRQYKATGDSEVRDQLIVSHLNLVRFLASKFKNRGEPLDDLIQVGTIGLIKAIDRFDPSRGLEFTTYATPTILGEIKRHFRDKGWSVRVPRRLQELSAKVNQANDELTNELSRSPSVEEIAKRVGASVDDVLEAMESSSAYSSVPLEGGGSSDDDDAPSVIDHYATEDEDLAASDDRIVLEDAIRDFSPREKDVIRMRFFEGMTQVEIAERLGISQVQVSRLLRRTLRRVQDKIDPEGLMNK